MTLLIANKDGLYTDRRKIHYAGEIEIPTDVCKIIVPNKEGKKTYALGMCGPISDDMHVLGRIGEVTAAMMFYRWFARWSEASKLRGPLINLSVSLGDVNDKILKTSLRDISTQYALVITEHGSVLIERDGIVECQNYDSVLTVGSSGGPGALLCNAGYPVPRVYEMAAKFDTMMSAKHDFIPRSDMHSYFPHFLYQYDYKYAVDVEMDLTAADKRWILLTEMINSILFITKRKNSKPRSPTNAELIKAWKFGTQAHLIMSKQSDEEIVGKLNELYSLK